MLCCLLYICLRTCHICFVLIRAYIKRVKGGKQVWEQVTRGNQLSRERVAREKRFSFGFIGQVARKVAPAMAEVCAWLLRGRAGKCEGLVEAELIGIFTSLKMLMQQFEMLATRLYEDETDPKLETAMMLGKARLIFAHEVLKRKPTPYEFLGWFCFGSDAKCAVCICVLFYVMHSLWYICVVLNRYTKTELYSLQTGTGARGFLAYTRRTPKQLSICNRLRKMLQRTKALEVLL